MSLINSNLEELFHHKTSSGMHDLKTNFDKIFNIVKSFLNDSLNADDNLSFYPRKPKMTDCEIITLSIVGECMGIDSENYLFGKIKADHFHDFPNLIDRSNFNRRRRRLDEYIFRLNKQVADLMNLGESIYLVDSVPVPVCKIVREKSSKICRENFETAPDKGYSAVNKAWYYGYKLHLVTSVNGVFSSMEMTKASVHDIHFLNEVKHSDLIDCTLIADKGYISEPIQLDLFTTCQIRLETPKRSNQHNKERFPIIFKRVRKRIETLFAQLCDQLMLKRNYAKSRKGLAIRLLCKITAVTILQYLNYSNNKPLNHLKYALAV
jgi:hypothetical protein